MEIKTFIEKKDFKGIRQLLAENPNFANEGITIPYDNKCATKAHPLHRICDAVFVKKMTDEEAIEIAKIFLTFGANIDGDKMKENSDTPLMAAASLHAEQLGIFYIEQGADIFYADKNDSATALHWAAFCGRDQLVKKLIEKKAMIDPRDKTYNATPLGWAIHALSIEDKFNAHHQLSCIKLLLKAGASLSTLNQDAKQHLNVLSESDPELKKLLH